MPNQEKPQGFELIELLIREAGSNAGASPSTSTQQGSDFESFKARFQSYIDQISSYLHSVGKEGFFPHFFLGSFSTLIDTEIAKKLDIEKIYFSFDGSKTLKVAVIRKGGITNQKSAIEKVNLFVISEFGKNDSKSKKFTYGELEEILGQSNLPAQNEHVRSAKDDLKVKLVKIVKATGEISVEVKDDKLDKNTSATHEFKEIKKGLWNNPESDIAKLTNPDVEKVKKPVENILKKISKIHSEYKNSLTYAQGTREAAHHGFIAGALVNFRYRHNLRVYLEQFAGRGYADIVLVPRGKDRSLNAIPVIIEMKAATKAELKEGKIGEKSGTTPIAALKQAEDYTKGFQPNVMRVLTTANDILCVGVNLDHPSPISDILGKSRNQKIIPLFNQILISIDGRNNGEITQEQLETRIQENIERIYHTFPGTGEKGDNHYFSRFLLGQSLLLNEVKGLNSDFEKQVFIYGENIPTETQSEPQSQRLKDQKSKGQGAGQPSKLDQSHGVTTMVFIPKNDEKSVYVMNIVETDGRAEILKKGIPLNKLEQKIGNRKVVELNLNFNIKEQKSDFKKYFSVEVNEPISLGEYNGKKSDKFKGDFKNVPYPKDFKKTFDEVLLSQLASLQDQSSSIGKYKKLFGKVGEAILPFKDLIKKEAHTQAVFHGAFSHYSDIKLGGSQENRALVLTEFQTGRGKRIDMLVHGIKFAGDDSNAKEYTPVGLELKGPREGKTADALKDEANRQIADEYTKGVTYKTLTDGNEVDFMGVVFDKEANSANSLILGSKDEFTPVIVVHSSVHVIPTDQVAQSIDISKGEHLRGGQEVIQKLKNLGIQEENLRTLESATAEQDYHYWLQQHDIADIARIKYGYGIDGADTLFEIVGSPEHIVNQLQQFQNSVTTRGERRPLTLVVNLDNLHWVTLVISYQNGHYNGYYVDSFGNNIPDSIRQVLQQAQITVYDVSIAQQTDGYNCGLWALENAHSLNQMIANGYDSDWVRDLLLVNRNEAYFQEQRENISDRLSIDPQRIANLEAVLAETQQNLNISPGKCLPNGGANRKKRNIGMACVDSRDEEKITEKEKLIKELFDTDEIRKRAKSIEFYNELFKVSERISKGKNVDLEGFIKRVKVIDSNSIDSKIRGIVTEIKGKISEEAIDKEGIKDILRRPEVAGEISKVVENIGLTYREFLDNGESEPRNIISRITSNREAMNHLNRIGKISGWAMHGMMYKNLVGDILSGDAEGVAIDLGFIGGNEALSKLANTAAIRGEKLISNGKLFLGKSLKAASPFLARGTTAFIAYDLANQVKEYKGGNKDAMVGIVGDSIVIAVDVAALGIEIAEVAGILTGVSSVTGPIGMAVTAVVFVGTEIYLAVKTVEKEDKIIHLTGWEKFKEGWRAFLHMPPEKYIQELINEKVANNHLVINGVNFLKQHTDIYQYVFPTGRVVGGQHIEVDPNNVVLLDAKKNNIKWSRARPDNPRKGGLFCLPQGNWESVPRGGAYVCKNAIGLSYSDHRTGSYTLIDLGEGNDKAIGFRDSSNIFFIGNGKKDFTGGNKNDTFTLHGDMGQGSLNGGLGYNTLDLTKFALRSCVDIEVPSGNYMTLSSQYGKTKYSYTIRGMQVILGREKAQDKIQCAHDVEYVDGKGGKDSNNPDIITTDHSSGPLKIVVRPNTKIINRSNKGSFSYIASHGKGEARIDIYHQTDQLKHTFLFNYTLSDLKNMGVQNLPNRNTAVKNVNFTFQIGSTDRFNIDIRNITTNASHVLLKDKTEIKIGNEDNLYALQSTDKPISDIIGNYPYIADRLNMTIAAQSHGEFVIIGHGKHEAMSNEPSCNSHLVGSGGENIYVVAPTEKKVNIYDIHNGTSISTLDLRSVVKDAQDVKISQNGNDLLIKLEEEKSLLKFPVRVKNGTHWYQKLHVVLDSIPMQVECSGDNWSLNLAPLTFDKNTKIVVITARNVKEGNKLIVHKQAGQHTFSRLRDDLIITTDPSLGESNVCTILLSNFYKEPKMQTLSIAFNDTMISLQEKMDEINNSKLVFCSNALQISERLSINGGELLDNYDCLKFNSDSMAFFRLNNDLLLLSDQGTSLISNYYSQVHEKWNLPVGLNNDIIKPEEFKKRADNPSSFRHYQPDEQGLQIYHNQPINKNDIGLVDLKDKSILDFDMKVINDNLLLSYKNNTLIKVENWNTYQPARKMIFAFNNTIVSNTKCIASTCNPGDVMVDFNKERVFDAIMQNNMTEAKGLMKKVESLNTDGKHELTPLYLAIKEDRLDVVKILFNQENFTLGDININGCTPLCLATQEGSLSIAEFFLNEGGYIFDGENPCGTPVRIAARNGNIQMLELLFNKDLNIQIQLSTLSGMIWLIQNIEEEFSNQTDISSNAKIWIKSFIEKLKDSMKGLAKRKLEQDMLDGCSYLSSNLSSEIDKFDKELLNEIITNVIEDMYGRVDMKKMLNCVYSYGSSDQSILGPMAVFDTMKTRGDLNKDAVFRLAYWIKEKMDFYKYPGVSAKEESDLEMLKNQLPKSVRNVVFASQVCIKNVGYQGRYLYAADFEGYPWLRRAENDTQRQPVFLWAPGGNPTERGIQQSLWRVEPAGDNVYIVNVGYQGRYLYAADFEGNPSLRHAKNDAQRQPIFLWAPGGKPTERGIQQSLWRVEPASDNVYIVNVGYQGRYLYAADFEGDPSLRRTKNDTQRRPIFLWAPGGKPTERGIQQSLWEVEECGSTAKKNVVSSTVTPHVIPVNSNVGHRGQRHLLSESLDSSNQPGIAASGGTKPSSWINDLCGWAKEKGGKLASGLVNGLYGDTTKELKDSKPADIQIDSSDQLKSKHPSYDQAQEMEFQYMSKYDARKSNDKNVGAYSKKRGNDRQAKQQYGSKMGNEQSVNQSRVVGNEKQQKLGVLHNGPKPTLSHHSNKNHSYFDGQPKKISERKEHIVNYKRCDESAYKHSNQHKPMISANNKWSERISNERIDSRKMIGGVNQKQQGFHQNQQSSHDSKHAHLTRATVQIDIPSTILAFSVLTAKVNNQKFNRPLLPKKVQKGKLHAEKVRAEALGRKVGGRIEGTLWFTK